MYRQNKQTYLHKSRWICACRRINDKEDSKCAFCGEPRPDKIKKGEARVKSSRCEYNGKWFQSVKERDYAMELDFRIKAGEVREWKHQHKIEIIVENKKICSYYIDFLVILKDGSRQYAEVKGFETQLWQLKWRLCMALKDKIDPHAEWIVIK